MFTRAFCVVFVASPAGCIPTLSSSGPLGCRSAGHPARRQARGKFEMHIILANLEVEPGGGTPPSTAGQRPPEAYRYKKRLEEFKTLTSAEVAATGTVALRVDRRRP